MMNMQHQSIVLLPGMDGTGLLFDPLVRSLGELIEPTIVAYPSLIESTWNAYADHVAATTKLEGTWLVAESFSGPVAINLLERHAPAIKGIVFVASFATTPRPLLLQIARLLPLSLMFRVRPPEFLIRYLLFDRGTPPGVLRLCREAHRTTTSRCMEERLRMIARIPKCERTWPNLPCLYLQAEHDRLVPNSCFESIRAWFPACSRVVVPGPHLLLQAQPMRTSEIIADFMAANCE